MRKAFWAQTVCCAAHIPKEALMRIPALAILMIATVLTAAPARAQTYDPAYPVCLRAHHYYECRYTSLPQCNASALGRGAQCFINPYFASAQVPADYRRHRRVY
jgi:hypothetical protein